MAMATPDEERGMLKLIFWDVQHGSAAYIKTPNETHMAVDIGTGSHKGGDRTFSPLRHVKYRRGVERLDYVVITHPHLDHIDDMLNFDLLDPRVLSRPRHLSKDDVWAGNREADGETRRIIEKYLEINARYSFPVEPGSSPLDASNNGGVEIKTFTPTESSASNLNNHSIVIVISYAELKVILSGDNEPPSWEELLGRSSFRSAISDADILLAAHHGRQSGFHNDLFKYFNPRLTVISDGRFSDTSATDRYAAVTRGWTVHRRSGGDIERKCVTTRNDGVIEIDLGKNPDGKPFISVTID